MPPFPPPAPARLAVTCDMAGRLVMTEEVGSPLDSRIDFPGLDLWAVVQLRSLRSRPPQGACEKPTDRLILGS